MGGVYCCHQVLDYFINFSDDWSCNIEIKIMFTKTFVNKKILIYGLGLSGNSCFEYLYKKNNVKVFDDNNFLRNKKNKKYFLSKKKNSGI